MDNYVRNLKKYRYTTPDGEHLKMWGQLDGGIDIYVHKLVSDLTAGELADELTLHKEQKLQAIDGKTGALINVGVDYGSPSEHFSLSSNAQINWLGLYVKKSVLTYPYEITCESGSYMIIDLTDMENFTDAIMGFIEDHVDSGRAFKASVQAATDLSEVDAVVDSR